MALVCIFKREKDKIPKKINSFLLGRVLCFSPRPFPHTTCDLNVFFIYFRIHIHSLVNKPWRQYAHATLLRLYCCLRDYFFVWYTRKIIYPQFCMLTLWLRLTIWPLQPISPDRGVSEALNFGRPGPHVTPNSINTMTPGIKKSLEIHPRHIYLDGRNAQHVFFVIKIKEIDQEKKCIFFILYYFLNVPYFRN